MTQDIYIKCKYCKAFIQNYTPCFFSGYFSNDGYNIDNVICSKCILDISKMVL